MNMVSTLIVTEFKPAILWFLSFNDSTILFLVSKFQHLICTLKIRNENALLMIFLLLKSRIKELSGIKANFTDKTWLI